jgi:hypothetical protein
MTVEDSLYVFTHVPRCAGTTVRAHIERNFALDACVPAYINNPNFYDIVKRSYSIPQTKRDILAYIQRMSAKQRSRIGVVYGHQVFKDITDPFERPARWITLLRNPVERAISHYRYNCRQVAIGEPLPEAETVLGSDGRVLSFETWFQTQTAALNKTTAFLCQTQSMELDEETDLGEEHLERACKILDGYHFVGVAEQFEEDALFIFAELGVTRFTGNKHVAPRLEASQELTRQREIVRASSTLDLRLYEHALELNRAFKHRHPEFASTVERIRSLRHPATALGRLGNAIRSDALYTRELLRTRGPGYVLRKGRERLRAKW